MDEARDITVANIGFWNTTLTPWWEARLEGHQSINSMSRNIKGKAPFSLEESPLGRVKFGA